MPLWLLEGFADYVALRDVDLPIATTAGQIIEQVRRDGPPAPPARRRRVRHHHHPPRGDLRERLARVPAAGPTPAGRRRWCASTSASTTGRSLGAALRASFGLGVARADPALAAAACQTWRRDPRRPEDVPRRPGRRGRGLRGAGRLAGALAPRPGRYARPRVARIRLLAAPDRVLPRTSRPGPACGATAPWPCRCWSPAGSASRGCGHGVVERLPGPWWVRVVLTVTGLVLVGRVVTLPFAVLLHRLLLDHGLTHQSWGGFAADLVRTEAVTIVTTSVGLVVLLGCARRWQRAWPAVAGGLLAGLVLAGLLRLPARGGAALQLLHAAAGRPAAHPDPRGSRTGSTCTSTTCWSRTPRGVRRR